MPSHLRALPWLTAFLVSFVSMCHSAPVRVFVLAGQSNMVGSGLMSDLSAEPVDLSAQQDDVYYHYWLEVSPTETYVASDWSSLRPLSGEVPGVSYGPELTFGRRLADECPDETIAIIKVAANGADLNTRWHPESKFWTLYQSMINHVALAMRQLEEQNLEPEISAFCWVQGATDALSESKAAAYEANLHALISSLRNDWAAPELPFVFNQYHLRARQRFGAIVRQGQANIAVRDPLAFMVNVDDLPLDYDRTHLSGIAQQELGYRLAAAYLHAVPEPNSVTVIAVGLAMIGLRRLVARCRGRCVRPRGIADML